MAVFKKKKHFSRGRLPHEKSRLRKVLITFGIVVLCALVLGGFWFLAQLGPSAPGSGSSRPVDSRIDEEVRELKEKSNTLEEEFEQIADSEDPGPEAIELLKRALELQEEYLDKVTAYDGAAKQRYRELKERYHEAASRPLMAESLELQEDAEDLADAGKLKEAGEQYSEALELQNTINQEYSLSSARDAGRAIRLERRARYLLAEPLYERSVELEEKADRLLEAGKREEAEEALQGAVDRQARINREFRGTSYANAARLQQLKEKQVKSQSGQKTREIEAIIESADRSRVEGKRFEAAELYRKAARLQRRLNERYPGSSHASTALLNELERKSQTAESFELGLAIERKHERLKRLLHERRANKAMEFVVELRNDLRQMETEYPESSLNDEDLQAKMDFLRLVQNDLGFIQDRVYNAVLSVPTAEDVRMLKTEVTQALYELIMRKNPSRNAGATLPVDSVSWVEADNFCERLSWILGKPVRLPMEKEFRIAIGDAPRFSELGDYAWSTENSPGAARPVGQKKPMETGFYDLLGNVSEWVESEDRFEMEAAMNMGGHVQDRLEVISSIPARETNRSERSRMIGFRFVMEEN
ncbi:MAG: SUMF1/EgtB/PvdO family nonheme iron enzyme [Opitutales bacterium]